MSEYDTVKKILENRKNQVRIQGFEEFFKLRKEWARGILGLLWVLVIFQIITTYLIGFGKVDFQNYRVFLYIVIGESFGQIIGLATIIVWFFFKGKSNKK
ncbi:MAG: hypothetical protein COU90_04295 [Candidatus Ryanbacteria bacterium CG10_big_fil_rev_8_21_14_0_10_43_42]|uniref:Uncharacterized protein n=1 Tax=Candidatus Ryanbacteria bacterium CG10_big_fil_rev_8_21_14_0_10_43_42 TaxID=1974864 RepID=A0A2M8KVW9_9BACT|nr:MAG: hypothetical protein COU90_04295 [Candidatus Ryanbacteria bacterium CG10_big_fil_rev_8_21_14_0_10_43_42]